MKWFTDLINSIKESNDKQFIEEINSLKKENTNLINKNLKISREILENNALIKQLNNEILELKKSKIEIKKDILDYEQEYFKKHNQTPFTYPFTGDNKSRDIKYALYLAPSEEKVILNAVKELKKKYTAKTPTDVVKNIQEYFCISGQYKYKKENIDIWNRANITWLSKEGDCDDLAILMHNLIYYWLKEDFPKHAWRIELVIANVLFEGGHALNKWLADDGEWYAVESTVDLRGNFYRSFLNAPLRFHNLYKTFRGFATKTKSFKGNMSSLDNILLKK